MKPNKKMLDAINARLPEHNLSADDCEVLPFMVFNNQLTDRFTIMTPEMMAKVVQDLNEGRAAFNKLHESRTALPVGHSVYGKIKDQPDGGKEIHAMMYAAVRRPDGTEFAEGKDLADRYKMGAVRSCSAGVIVGFYKCNICGNDIRDYNKCEHLPGRQYEIDEQPKTCIAFMTGHKINDGVAEDCGIYEVSAVTAGGVAAASAMTEAFGRYEDGSDVKEFKKTVIDDKGIDMRLEFSAAPNPEEFEDSSSSSEEETGMEKNDVKAMLDEHYAPLKAENDKLTTDMGKLQGEFDAQATELTTATDKVTALEGQIETKDAEFAAQATELETAKNEATEATGFKAEYTALVLAKGIKSGAEVTEEEFATKTLDELKTLNEGYDAAIAAMPDGQQTGNEGDAETGASLDDSFYKS
jgi:hypothetical protein